MSREPIVIRGAGVTGLCCAVTLLEHGFPVVVEEAGDRVGSGASWKAGGMLAPWCESEAAPQSLIELAAGSLDWWCKHVPSTVRNGTLVVMGSRDRTELARFARRTTGHDIIGSDRIADLEPTLAGRFDRGLFFPGEGHLDPREALTSLAEAVRRRGGSIRLNAAIEGPNRGHITIDASGFGAVHRVSALRGVRGEMMLVRCSGMTLARPVRLLHPRHPIYVVPRAGSIFMIGATMVETENAGPMTIRSAMELLAAAYALQPAFGDAEIVEFAAGLRPTFPDHLPEVGWEDDTLFANGMYRHGFLLGPVLADRVLQAVLTRMNRS